MEIKKHKPFQCISCGNIKYQVCFGHGRIILDCTGKGCGYRLSIPFDAKEDDRRFGFCQMPIKYCMGIKVRD